MSACVRLFVSVSVCMYLRVSTSMGMCECMGVCWYLRVTVLSVGVY